MIGYAFISAFRRLAYGVRYLVLLFAVCTLTMMASYGLVLYLGHRMAGPTAFPQADMVQAKELGAFSTELVRLTAEFVDRASNEAAAPSAALQTWAAQDFVPRVNDLRRRLIAVPAKNDVLTALLAAADQVAAMGASPRQVDLRRAAVDSVLDAGAQVETYARGLGIVPSTGANSELRALEREQ